MKIILVTASADLVGVAVHVYNLARLLHGEGMLDLVVCPSDGWLARQLAESGVPCSVMRISPDPRTYLSASRAFVRLLRSRKAADIVHLHGRFPLFVSALSFIMCRRYTFVATVHQFTERSADGPLHWKARLEALLLRGTHRICCVSEDLKNEVSGLVGTKKAAQIDVIPNWIEPMWLDGRDGRKRAEAAAGSEEPRICAAGYLLQVKGFDILLRAIGILRQRGCRVHCDIFGKGPDKDNLLTLAEQLGVAPFISFKDPTANLRRLLPDYDAVVVPSRSESFSLVALEAYDASVPVVASNVRGLRETVVDGLTGLLFERGSCESLAEKLQEVLGSNALADRLVANARQHLRDYVPNPGLARSYREFYEKAQTRDATTSIPVGRRETFK